MPQFVPTRSVVQRLELLGLSWAEMVEDLSHAQHIQPMHGYDTRLRYLGSKCQGYIEPGTHDGEDALFVIGVRLRCSAEEPAPEQIVGRETKVIKSRKRGGSGRRWPTTWPELIKRIELHPRARVFKGTNHWLVYLDGKQVDALPTSTSDHRALLNACQQLKNRGIDVSRTAKVAA